MVTIRFKLSEAEPVRLEVDMPARLEEVLPQAAAQANVELGGYIAIRNGEVITSDHLVESTDVIDVFPALSGG